MKKIICVILALTLVMALSVTAFADNITTSGGSATTPVMLDVDAASFSVTLPTSFPIDVQRDGAIAYATNLAIKNNNNAKIKVTDLTITGQNGWTLAAYNTDFSKQKVNLKQFGFKFEGSTVPTTGVADLSSFQVISANTSRTLSYEANVATQASTIEDVQIANAVFTVGWYTGS